MGNAGPGGGVRAALRVGRYSFSALGLGLAFTLALTTLAWRAEVTSQERVFARAHARLEATLEGRLRALDSLLSQSASLAGQGVALPVLSALCTDFLRSEPALDALLWRDPGFGGAAAPAVLLCGETVPRGATGIASDTPPAAADEDGNIPLASDPATPERFILARRVPRPPAPGASVAKAGVAATAPGGGATLDGPALWLVVDAERLLAASSSRHDLVLALWLESPGPLGRQALQAGHAQAKAALLDPLVAASRFDFRHYSLRLEARRPLAFNFGLPASAALLGAGVTLLMVALARAREHQLQELATRNRWVEEQVALKTRELAAARDAAYVAVQARSDFLARMSHEIRTPLNAIQGTAEALAATAPTPEQQPLISMCRRACENLLLLVNDVLDLSKIEAGGMLLENVDFPLPEIFEEAATLQALAAAGKGLEMVLDLGADLPATLTGDPVRLRQILLNLLANAVKFTAQGEVVLKAWVEAGEAESRRLCFSVHDTGIGIAPDKLETVFENFTQADSSMTRRYGGTGLGLSISRQLMSGMGGRLWAESPGAAGGACLRGELPLTAALATSAPVSAARSAPRVLVIEPNRSQRVALARRLEALGARVEVAADATGAPALPDGRAPDLLLWGVAAGRQAAITEAAAFSRDVQPGRTLVLLPATGAELRSHCAAAGLATETKPPRTEVLRHWLTGTAAVAQRVAPPGPVDSPSLEIPRAVLLVEDNADNRTLVHVFLRGQPCEITEAVDGLEATRLCAARAFDLVLMDIQMPVMDGHEATRRIRAIERDAGRWPCRILALTAHALPEELNRMLAAGCDGYLTKPLNKQTLLEALVGKARQTID